MSGGVDRALTHWGGMEVGRVFSTLQAQLGSVPVNPRILQKVVVSQPHMRTCPRKSHLNAEPFMPFDLAKLANGVSYTLTAVIDPILPKGTKVVQ
ncbi:hypothetical protein SKAU_G00346150 [Synaphobranchus kaupii]|uniref:Uncharacterized protein n=1 Tax=Synaphobranchus kaupii TaxID=118154 RepID=A0A9Q1EJL0_SYNKA|nr:hypothetical protein SKAU_G00346150 [Synaphobranchus kaupii]